MERSSAAGSNTAGKLAGISMNLYLDTTEEFATSCCALLRAADKRGPVPEKISTMPGIIFPTLHAPNGSPFVDL